MSIRSPAVVTVLARADAIAAERRHAGAGIEHVLLAALDDRTARELLAGAGAHVDDLRVDLDNLLKSIAVAVRPQLATWLATVEAAAAQRGAASLEVGELVARIAAADHSAAIQLLRRQGVTQIDVLRMVAHGIRKDPAGAASVPPARVVRGAGAPTASGRYRVVMHNDDFTPYALVIELVSAWFGKSPGEAIALARQVHAEGRAVVGVLSLRAATKTTAKLMRIAERAGSPLLFTIEPD